MCRGGGGCRLEAQDESENVIVGVQGRGGKGCTLGCDLGRDVIK